MNVALSYLLEKEEVFQRIVDEYGLPVVPSRPAVLFFALQLSGTAELTAVGFA